MLIKRKIWVGTTRKRRAVAFNSDLKINSAEMDEIKFSGWHSRLLSLRITAPAFAKKERQLNANAFLMRTSRRSSRPIFRGDDGTKKRGREPAGKEKSAQIRLGVALF